MSHTLRFSLTNKANKLACSYGDDRPVRITIIPRKSWLSRLFMGNPYACLNH